MRMRWQAAAAVVSALLLCLLVVELLSNQGLLQLDRFSSSSTGCRGAHSRHPDSRLPHSIRSWCGEHGSSGASAEAQRTSDCRHRHRSRAQLLNCSSSYGPWLLPAYNLEKGMLLGDTQRVAAAMSRLLLQGRNLTVGFLGGSITEGVYFRDRGDRLDRSWPAWMMHILASYLPGNAVQRLNHVNGAISATTSRYASMCHQRRLTQDVDVVFIEFAVNDPAGPHTSMERLIRKVLQYPNRPAAVLMNFYRWMDPVCLPQPGDWGNFRTGGYDREFTELARYYDLPVLSVRMCCHDLMQRGVHGFSVARPLRPSGCFPDESLRGSAGNASLAQSLFYDDEAHPGGQSGARAMGEMAAALLLNAAVGLEAALGASAPSQRGSHASGPTERTYVPTGRGGQAAPTALPAPMFLNNWEQAWNATCFMWDDVHALTVSHEGWEWTEEGRRKWGWVATSPGAKLQIKVPALLPRGAQAAAAANAAVAANAAGIGGRKGGVGGALSAEAEATAAPVVATAGGQPLSGAQGDGAAAAGYHPQPRVALFLNFLSSYERMGKAAVECVSGCACNRTVINALRPSPPGPRVSLTDAQAVWVTESPHCLLQVTVLDETDDPGGGHKFKVVGITVVEDGEDHRQFGFSDSEQSERQAHLGAQGTL